MTSYVARRKDIAEEVPPVRSVRGWMTGGLKVIILSSLCASTQIGSIPSMYQAKTQKTGMTYLKASSESFLELADGRDASTRNEEVKYVLQQYGMSISEFSRIVGVSRQAVHEWLKGSAISDPNIEKIKVLQRIADQFSDAGLPINTKVLRRAIDEHGSLIDYIRSEADLERPTKILLSIVSEEKAQRDSLNKRVKSFAAAVPTESFGIPFHRSDS